MERQQSSAKRIPGTWGSLLWRWEFWLITLTLMPFCFGVVVSVLYVTRAAYHRHVKNRLTLAGIGLHEMHEEHERFPMAVAFRTPDGRPGLSWRVAILPYLGEEALYRQFRLDESWDSPHNQTLVRQMPRAYQCDWAFRDNREGLTYFQAFRGKRCLFDESFISRKVGPKGLQLGRTLREVPDGSSNTLMLGFARTPVPWTAPEDIDTDDGRLMRERLLGLDRGLAVCFGDGSVRVMWLRLEEQKWRALLTVDGDEPWVNH